MYIIIIVEHVLKSLALYMGKCLVIWELACVQALHANREEKRCFLSRFLSRVARVWLLSTPLNGELARGLYERYGLLQTA